MDLQLGSWALLMLSLVTTAALVGAWVWTRRTSLDPLRAVGGFAAGGFILFICLLIGGLRGDVEPDAIWPWVAGIPMGAMLGALISAVVQAREKGNLATPADVIRRIVRDAISVALAVAAVELVAAVPALQLHLLLLAAAVALSLPLAVLAQQLAATDRWPWPKFPVRYIPLIGATIGLGAAFVITLGGAREIAAVLRFWPIALGAAATLVPLLRRRLGWMRDQVRSLVRRDIEAVVRISTELVRQASRPAWPSMLVSLMAGTGVGALLVPNWVVRAIGLGLIGAAVVEGVRLRPTDTTRKKPGVLGRDAVEEKPLLRGILHLPAGIIGLGIAVWIWLLTEPGWIRTSALVYLSAGLLLFWTSSVYNRLGWKGRAAVIARRLDHSNVYLFIFGTLFVLAPQTDIGRAMLVAAGIGAVVGIAVKWRWPNRKILGGSLYLMLGWVPSLVVVFQLIPELGWPPFWIVAAGGIAYTVGMAVWALKKPDPWPAVFGYHEIFHVLTLVGAGLHLWAIVGWVIPVRNLDPLPVLVAYLA